MHVSDLLSSVRWLISFLFVLSFFWKAHHQPADRHPLSESWILCWSLMRYPHGKGTGPSLTPCPHSSSLTRCREGWSPVEVAAFPGHRDAVTSDTLSSCDSSATGTAPKNSFITLIDLSVSMIIKAKGLRWWKRNNQGQNADE